MKSGYVAIVGRPNSGKSTLLNTLLKKKVSITSPKPQTTRFSLEAVYEDDRGQIVFIDTPGMFGRVKDKVSRKINMVAPKTVSENIQVVIHLVDHSRERDVEENKIIGLLRKIDKPKILTINKIDIKKPSYLPHYKFLEEEYDKVIEISALYNLNTNRLLDAIFELLPEGEKLVDASDRPTPVLNIDSKIFIAEIIREKAFLFLRKEIPYSLAVIVDEIQHRENDLLYILARIVTSDARYKRMIIGSSGYMIKEIGRAARKELETASSRKVFLDLSVVVDPHWVETML